MKYELTKRGAPNSVDYRIFISDENGPLSTMHDIPLYVDVENHIYNAVVLGPRWTNCKMQLSMRETLNPIRHENKKGILRYIANCFPHHGYIWNYCVLPQTWRCSELVNDGTGTRGDNRPVEALEIGSRIPDVGEILEVKLLGTIALVGETGWKVLAIDTKDPLAAELNDLEDISTYFPGLLKATLEWYKVCPIADGKPDKSATFTGDAKGAIYAQNVVKQYHKFWNRLIMNEVDAKCISRLNTSHVDSPFRIHSPDAKVIIDEAPPTADPIPLEETVDVWHFIELS